MFKKLSNKEQGFTIIEVLIVLAIAGLIMVVVFLAVPGLQRSQRNSQQRTEANNLLAAAGEVSGNKGGSALSASVSTTAGSDAANVLSSANTKNITLVTIEAQAGATQPTSTSAVIRTGAKCTAANSNATPAGVNSRQYALLFDVETSGGGTQVQCINS
jgi:prepilin-type N-terminal cleavage/methylation domain-containing protein